MNSIRSARLASLLLLALPACGGDGDAGTVSVRFDTLPGGVVHVVNRGPTAWADTSGWRLVEESPIAPPDGSPGELGEIIGVVANDDGMVAVLQAGPVSLHLFSGDGTHLRQIGRSGSGPGEYGAGIVGIHRDTLVVQDPSNSRMTVFLTDGTLIGSYPTTCCAYQRTLAVDDRGRAAIPWPVGENRRTTFHLTDLAGAVRDTIVVPAEPERRLWRVPAGRFEMTLPIPLQGEQVARIRPDGLLLHGVTDRYRFVLSSDGADTVRIIESAAPAVALSAAEKDSVMNAALRWAEDSAAFRTVVRSDDIPDHWPPWTQAAVDGRNRLWVGLPGSLGPVSMLQVFDQEGRLLGNVPVPHPDVLKGTWTRDRVYVRSESEEGFPVIRVFRIVTAPAD